jgi:undecaprenyl-diphosphatase
MVALGAATDLLPLGVAGLGLAALLLWRGRRSDAVLLLSILGVAMVGNRVLKELVARPRPEVRSVPEALSTYSFPSGHAASTAAMAGALVLLTRTPGARARVAAAGIVLVVAVAISRLAVGAHYPSDIIGGWLWIGALIAFAAARMKTRGESTDAR